MLFRDWWTNFTISFSDLRRKFAIFFQWPIGEIRYFLPRQIDEFRYFINDVATNVAIYFRDSRTKFVFFFQPPIGAIHDWLMNLAIFSNERLTNFAIFFRDWLKKIAIFFTRFFEIRDFYSWPIGKLHDTFRDFFFSFLRLTKWEYFSEIKHLYLIWYKVEKKK